MQNRKAMWGGLLLLAAVLVGCGVKLVQAWAVRLGEEPVQAMWISAADQQLHLLRKTDTGARLEQVNVDGQPGSGVEVETIGWTGLHAVDTRDDAVYLLEQNPDDATDYSVLKQFADGASHRFALALPVTDQDLRVTHLRTTRSPDQLLMLSRRDDASGQPPTIVYSLVNDSGVLLGQFVTPPREARSLHETGTGYVWAGICAESVLFDCDMRVMVLDEQLQVQQDYLQSVPGLNFASRIFMVDGKMIVTASDDARWVFDPATAQWEALQDQGGTVLGYSSATEGFYGVYFKYVDKGTSHSLCFFDQSFDMQWCKGIPYTVDQLYLNSTDYSAMASQVLVQVDGDDNAYVTYSVRHATVGLAGNITVPLQDEDGHLTSGVIDIVTRRTYDSYVARFTRQGKLAMGQEAAPYVEKGWLEMINLFTSEFHQRESTAGPRSVSNAMALPDGGLYVLSRYQDDVNGDQQQLARWD